MNIKKVCVLGAGIMGSGIAQVCAQAGFEVSLRDIEQRFVDKGMDAIASVLGRAVKKGKKTQEEVDAILGRITPVTDLNAAASGADIVVEAAVEDIEIKKKIFQSLEELVPEHCLFFTNTSGLSITEMAASTKRADKFLGTHFFNPVPLMRLLELVKGYETSDETVEIAREWGAKLGKECIVVEDSPMFAANRVVSPMIHEAFIALESGVASAEDIDKGVMLGYNHPIGPLALADLIGLDTLLKGWEEMYSELGGIHRPSLLMKKLVKAGRLGRKTGKGVFDYTKK